VKYPRLRTRAARLILRRSRSLTRNPTPRIAANPPDGSGSYHVHHFNLGEDDGDRDADALAGGEQGSVRARAAGDQLGGKRSPGAKFHVAWFGDDGFHVLDLWESAEEFQRFTEERLMPGVQKIGIQGQPRVEFAEAHAVFAPNV
jgi:hypothetical protein